MTLLIKVVCVIFLFVNNNWIGNLGEATITLITVFLQQKEEQFYLYFCNDEVGDFCVHLTLIPTLGKDKIPDLEVQALPNIETTICKCKRGFSRSCPRNFVVNLPRKNNFLWTSTTALCNNCFSGDTINLVKDYFGTLIFYEITENVTNLPYNLLRLPHRFPDTENLPGNLPSRFYVALCHL